MRAITEIPANTPRPIGRTDRCFPGRVKAASVVAVASAAAAAESGAGDTVAAALDCPPVTAAVGERDGVEGGDADAAVDKVVVADDAPNTERPRVVTGIGTSVCVALESTVELLLLLSDEEFAVVEVELMVGDGGIGREEDALVEEAVVVEFADDAVEEDEVALVDVTDDAEVALVVDVADDDGEAALAVDEVADDGDEEIPVALGDPDKAWLFAGEPELAAVVTVHDFTSWTAGLPSASMTGVRVIVHVSVMGPIMVWLV